MYVRVTRESGSRIDVDVSVVLRDNYIVMALTDDLVIEYNGTRISLDHEHSIYGRKWYRIIEPIYNVDIPGETDDYWISSYVYPVLKFLKTNYPIYIRLRSKRKMKG